MRNGNRIRNRDSVRIRDRIRIKTRIRIRDRIKYRERIRNRNRIRNRDSIRNNIRTMARNGDMIVANAVLLKIRLKRISPGTTRPLSKSTRTQQKTKVAYQSSYYSGSKTTKEHKRSLST